MPGGGGLRFTSFDQPVGSPTGARYIMLARTNSGSTTNDALYMVGATQLGGGTGAGTVVVREGVTVIEPGRVAENMSDRRAGVLDSGDFVVTLDLSGVATNDRVLYRSLGGVPGIAVREGDALGALPGLSVGTSITDAGITSDGSAVARFDSIAGAASTANSALVGTNGTLLLAREGDAPTAPTNTLAGGNWSAFDFGNFWSAADGSWLARGTISDIAARDQVLAVNNQVRLQEGLPIPTFGTLSAIISANMVSNGRWFARGTTSVGAAFLVIDDEGTFYAASSLPMASELVDSPGEFLSTVPWNVANGVAFLGGTANSCGDTVVAGFTSSPNQATNAVWLVNVSRILMRRGVTPIDLNANGLEDDDLFVGITGLTGASLNNKTDSGFLTDDGWYYFVADMVNSAGTLVGEGFLRIRAVERTPCSSCPTCPADFDQDGGVTDADVEAFFLAFESGNACGDTEQDGGVTGADVEAFFLAFEAGGC